MSKTGGSWVSDKLRDDSEFKAWQKYIVKLSQKLCWGLNSAVEHLPSMHSALDSILCANKNLDKPKLFSLIVLAIHMWII